MRWTLFLLVVPAACSVSPATPPPEPPKVALAVQVEQLTRPHCGKCHTASSPEADAKCLAVFDYEKDWVSMLSKARVDKFVKRARGKLDADGQQILDAWARQAVEP